MTDKFLIERVSQYLDRMGKYYLNEDLLLEEDLPDQNEEQRADWMPPVLHDFMFHLSGPSDPHGNKKKILMEEVLDEATLININKGLRPLAHKNMNLPKTSAIINKTEEERGGSEENLHKKLSAGFRKADGEMASEDRKTRRAKLSEARKAFQQFAQARGFKSKTPPKMLGGNMKTEKSSGEGVLTTGLNLAPHATAGLHGFDTCPKASKDCRTNCLGTEAGGNRQYPDAALAAKTLRTHFVAHHPEHAARIIDAEIEAHKKSAKKKGMIPGVRLNVTSDISWEHHAPKMFERHKDVQFYDYTKMPNRVMRQYEPKVEGSHFNKAGHPANYHLTLSHTGTGHAESNDADVVKVLERGGVVASVFQRGKKMTKPTAYEDVKTGKRYPVSNGDDDDNTFDRHTTLGKTEGAPSQGVVSGLQLKGVKNEDAGAFANKVDDDGIVRINK
jgi:hypothetical protein